MGPHEMHLLGRHRGTGGKCMRGQNFSPQFSLQNSGTKPTIARVLVFVCFIHGETVLERAG
eukprot:358532-Chlamydomonas_euryale.AAC.11